jgi:5-methylcytosine-specific restriction endonuclease McrA
MAVLALDITGTPRQWISTDDAITYHAKKAVAWTLGNVVAKYRGGIQNDGTESYIETPSIIAIKGHGFNPAKHGRVALTNRTLFGRDRHVCAYCGGHFTGAGQLSRDHIMPRSRGGTDDWMNVVTACKKCNTHTGSKTLKEARLELIYVPYVPNHFENLILQNRNILADQMEYLLSGVPKHSRVILS